jgi:hypothetical protein
MTQHRGLLSEGLQRDRKYYAFKNLKIFRMRPATTAGKLADEYSGNIYSYTDNIET